MPTPKTDQSDIRVSRFRVCQSRRRSRTRQIRSRESICLQPTTPQQRVAIIDLLCRHHYHHRSIFFSLFCQFASYQLRVCLCETFIITPPVSSCHATILCDFTMQNSVLKDCERLVAEKVEILLLDSFLRSASPSSRPVDTLADSAAAEISPATAGSKTAGALLTLF